MSVIITAILQANPYWIQYLGGGIDHALDNNKKSKRIGAVLGAVVGATIISESRKSSRHKNRYRDQYHNDCHRKIIGYKVKYRYRSRIYRISTDHHPGTGLDVIIIGAANNQGTAD